MGKEKYQEFFSVDTIGAFLPDSTCTYLALGDGVYSVVTKEKDTKVRPLYETRIFPRKCDPPLDEHGNPISEERQEQIIKDACERAKRRTQPLVLTLQSDFRKGTLAEKVA